jgi:uncharacterized protein (TIGR02466 family)
MNLNYIFPTPIWQDILSCDLYNIKMYILSEQSSDNGRKVSNVNGWQSKSFSPDELMETPVCQFITALEKKIKLCLEDYGSSKKPVISNIWFNVNPHGASNSTHVHTDSFLSGVFYVQAPSECGDIVFERQAYDQYILGSHIRNSTHISSAAQWKFTPKHNMLLIFPAWIPHHVEINSSSTKRISISFNILQV